MKTKNYGLIIPEIDRDRNWIFGAANSIGGAEVQPDHNWAPFLPQGEEQYNKSIDLEACTVFGTLNAVELLQKRLYGDDTNWSDLFLAVASGVTPSGCDPHKVAETLRSGGDVREEDYPFRAEYDTWEKAYKPLPSGLLTLAIGAFKAQYDFRHEWVPTYPAALMNALKYSPIAISLFAWAKDGNGLYYQPAGFSNNHWVVLVDYVENDYWLVFDSYDLQGDYLKKVRWDMPFAIAKRYSLARQVVKESAFQIFLKWLRSIAFGEPEPEPAPLPAPAPLPPPAPTPARDMLNEFCLAIQSREGYIGPGVLKDYPSGTPAYRNKNPGNLRCTPVRNHLATAVSSTGFCIFPDYATGLQALKNVVTAIAKGQSDTYNAAARKLGLASGGELSVLQFFETYAPASDSNDPVSYAKEVAGKLGVDYQAFKIKQLI